MESIFDHLSLRDIHEEIKKIYLQYPQPWVIGYSGGKDSTAVLQLVWNAIKSLDSSERKKPIYVIASDTKVETPVIVDYIDNTLYRINQAAIEQSMPFQAQKVLPSLNESFWVNLLGRGYPAPTIKFRWCTERMKINPANRFVRQKVEEYGEILMVLGTRKAESSTRAQLMNTYRVQGHSSLRYHKYLVGAYVYAPIADFTADDVWTYLFQVTSPWGSDNRGLAAIYRNANAQGECPLVIDASTPSCGNSRFGCWVCTVVEKDVSMGNIVRNGEEWLKPLFDLRNHLAATRNDERYRSIRGRDGSIRTRNGHRLQGSYRLEAVQGYLAKLLDAQKRVQKVDPDAVLVSKEELVRIRQLWSTDGVGARIDWADTVPKIYRAVMNNNNLWGEGVLDWVNMNWEHLDPLSAKVSVDENELIDLDWPIDDNGCFDAEQKSLLIRACQKENVSFTLVARLLEAERKSHGMARRASIHRQIASELRKDWRSEEDILTSDKVGVTQVDASLAETA